MAMRGSWAVFLVAPLLLLTEGAARADAPASSGPTLRPSMHIDRHGRRLVDVCPERTPGERRCHLQRILAPSDPDPQPVPLSGGLTCGAGGILGSGSPPTGAATPTDLLAAYNIPSTAKANGAIVAVVDLTSTNSMLDVNTYRSAFGIPTLPACPVNSKGVPVPALAEGGVGLVPCFARVGRDGTVNTISPVDCSGGPSQETSVDVDMVSALCPDCSIVVAEAQDSSGTYLDQMSLIAAPPSCTGGVLGASAVSTSWGTQEYPGADDAYFSCADILTLASAGDQGYIGEDYPSSFRGPDWPATSPHVLGVGGTTLSPFLEVVWDDDSSGGGGATGSGCSGQFAMPSYQSGSGFNFGTCKMRAANDVAAVAEWNGAGGGGVAVYNYDNSGWAAYHGTSVSSPVVAAIMVRLGLGGKDQHALFYKNGGAFNDILSGNNDSKGICTDKALCFAGREWDGPTGLGSPNGALLLALAGGTLEPEPDAGPLDSGPPADAGVDSGGGMDSGKDSGSDAGHKPTKHPIGAPCTGSFECSGTSQCVAPPTGKGTVCAPICGGAAPACPTGYACQGGYCFSGSPAPDGGTGNKPPPTASSGCACSAATSSSSSWAAAGWLTLGLLAVTRRRKR